jgi:hypothetical protein
MVWSGEIERNLAKLSNDYPYLPFFLLIILYILRISWLTVKDWAPHCCEVGLIFRSGHSRMHDSLPYLEIYVWDKASELFFS